MNSPVSPGETVGAAPHKTIPVTARNRLVGHMGVATLLFTVMALNTPLGTFVATAGVPIGFGNGVGAPVFFIFGGAIMALFAVGFLKMAPFVKNSGGFYVYVSAGLGKAAGLGTSFLALATYFVLLIGSLVFSGYTLNALITGFGGPELPWWFYSFVHIAIIAVLGYVRIDASAKVLTVLLLLELVIIIWYNAAVMFTGGAEGLAVAPSLDLSNIFSGSIGIALLIGVTTMAGFEATTVFREEVKRPKTTIPRATFLFILITAVMYTVTAWSMIQAVGWENAKDAYGADPSGTLLDTMTMFMGKVGHDLVLVLLVTSTLAANLAIHNISTRYVFNLSNDRVFPTALAKVNPKQGSPSRASLAVTTAVSLLIILLAVIGAGEFLYIQLLSSFAYGFILLLTVTTIALLVFLNKRKPAGTTVWHRIIAPGLALVGVGIVLIFGSLNLEVVFGEVGPAAFILIGMFYGLFIIGVVVALVLRARKAPAYELIGRLE